MKVGKFILLGTVSLVLTLELYPTLLRIWCHNNHDSIHVPSVLRHLYFFNVPDIQGAEKKGRCQADKGLLYKIAIQSGTPKNPR